MALVKHQYDTSTPKAFQTSISLKLHPEDKKMLNELCEVFELSQSAAIRRMIRLYYKHNYENHLKGKVK